MSAAELLAWYIALHNLGIETSDFSPLLALFADDAIVEFKDISIGSIQGKDAIVNAFTLRPPSTAIIVSDIEESGLTVRATYSNSTDPFVKLGTIHLESDGEKIRRIMVGN
jgi:hypothetical protein